MDGRAEQRNAKNIMNPELRPEPSEGTELNPALRHVSHAKALLIGLQGRIGDHPELSEAITKLESALSLLTLETGGLL
ncbi:MAG TPA: hypothetical protein VF753_04885 [Terriglobales bacterium]